jgi:hypothetical protein
MVDSSTPNDSSTALESSASAVSSDLSSTNSASSLPSCNPTVTLEISKEVHDFGKFTPPDVENWARIEVISDRLKVIRDRMVEIINQTSENPENTTHWEELKFISNEAKALCEELQGFGFTITPLVPLAVDGDVTLTLKSTPSGLPGGISFTETHVRRGQNSLEVGVGDWEPPATGSGTTNFTVEFSLTGNYGIVTFQGSVECCDWNYESNKVTLVVTGMCRGEAQAELNAFLALKGSKITTIVGNLTAIGALAGSAMAMLINCLLFVPFGSLPIAIAALAAFAGALIANHVAAKIREEWIAAEKKIREQATPYINSLPPCE